MRPSLKRFNLETKTGRLYNALVNEGQRLTAAQIAKQFSLKNPTASISDVRRRGYAVYAETVTFDNNVTSTVYRHGDTNRELTVLGYLARSQGITV
jgi:glutaminase